MRPSILLLACSSIAFFACASKPPPAATPTSSTVPAPAPTASASETSDLVPPGEAKVGDKTRCPVSGDVFVVEADSPKVEVEGKTYFFCCPGCAKKFEKDPKAYTAPK